MNSGGVTANENEKRVLSVLEGEGYYFNKILNRDASNRSVSSSTDLQFHGNVPFEWEMHPGIPKKSENIIMDCPEIPQISPPPFSPRWEDGRNPSSTSNKGLMKGWTGFMYWKRTKKYHHHRHHMGDQKNVDRRRSVDGLLECIGRTESEGERRHHQLGFCSDDMFVPRVAAAASSSSCNWSSSSSSSPPPTLCRNNVHLLPSTSKLRGVPKRFLKWPF